MHVRSGRRRIHGRTFLPFALVLVALLMVMTACGDDEATSTPATSAADTVPATTAHTGDTASSTITSPSSSTSAAPSTSKPVAGSEAPSTSSTEATTTIAKVTTTTAKPTTTTAKPTTTTAKPTTTTAKPTTTTAAPTTTTAKKVVAITVSGPSGTKELSMAELKAMSAVSGYGGWKNQLGNITAPVSWKGVSVKSLLDLVGGGSSCRVVASDGYEAVLSSAELSGQSNLYDPSTGEAISSISGSLRVIVAYAKSGSALSSGEGPLRIAFVSSEKDQVTDSDQWVKKVVAIKAR